MRLPKTQTLFIEIQTVQQDILPACPRFDTVSGSASISSSSDLILKSSNLAVSTVSLSSSVVLDGSNVLGMVVNDFACWCDLHSSIYLARPMVPITVGPTPDD